MDGRLDDVGRRGHVWKQVELLEHRTHAGAQLIEIGTDINLVAPRNHNTAGRRFQPIEAASSVLLPEPSAR